MHSLMHTKLFTSFKTSQFARDDGACVSPTTPGAFVPLCQQVEQVAVQHPTAVAVRSNFEHSHTYAELHDNAGGLARHFQSLGISTGSLVAVAFDRSYSTVVTLMATWLAGAAYMAIDPAYPVSRIEYILKDAGVNLIVTTPGCHHLVPGSFEGPVIELDPRGVVAAEMGGTASEEAPARELPLVTADMLACIWYTSGTSGNPKGVLIDHGAFAQAVSNIPKYPGFGPGCCFGQVSSPCYAGHVADLWKPLTVGATLAIIPTEVLLDPWVFGRAIKDLEVRGLILTPKILEMFADVAPEVLAPLKLIQFAGERVRLDAVLKLVGCLAPGTLVQHLYGCSEHCSIISALQVVAGPEAAATLAAQTTAFGRLPVGQAVRGAKIYILDPDTLQELPDGEVGEVCVAGRQLAIGYHNRPDVTAEKFTERPGTRERIYRTGDLGRIAPHGLGLDLMGRAGDDGMIKINGHRIELGDIEAAAMASGLHATAAAATVRQDSRLVLYVAPSSVDIEELKQRLRAALPAYMVPTLIEALPAIPLNVHGKVDRNKLPEPKAAMSASLQRSMSMTTPKAAAADVTDMELDIMYIFAEVLQVSPRALSVLSSFTGLSGHSLQAMSLLGMLRKQLECPALQLTDILEDDCPRYIASLVERYRSPHYKGSVLPDGVQCVAAGKPGQTPVWVLPGGQGRPRVGLQVGKAMTQRPLYAIEITEETAAVSAAHPVHRVDGLVAHYIGLIKQVQPQGPYIVAGNRLAYTVAHTLEQAGDAVQRCVILDDSPLQFSRKVVDAGATLRHDKGVFGLIKFNVLRRAFPNDPERVEAELDRYERTYYEHMPQSDEAYMDYTMDAMAEEVGRWLGFEEGRRWRLGLHTALPLLTNKERPCVRFDQDVIKAPISVVKASDSWMHTRVNELYDPAGLHDYSWSSFTSAGPPDVHVVPGNHYTMGDCEKGSAQLAHLLDTL